MLSVRAVSERLGVSERRVRAMIASGRLPATRVGRSWIIDAASLARVEGARPGGRPLGSSAAWRELLDDDAVPPFDAGVLRSRYRRRAEILRCDSPTVDEAVADEVVALGGWSAACRHDRLIDEDPTAPHVAYVNAAEVHAWRERHWLVPSETGPIIAAVVDPAAAELLASRRGRIVPARVAAVDLAEMGGVRRLEAARRLWDR
jgi:excisionase family DNA binding protein